MECDDHRRRNAQVEVFKFRLVSWRPPSQTAMSSLFGSVPSNSQVSVLARYRATNDQWLASVSTSSVGRPETATTPYGVIPKG